MRAEIVHGSLIYICNTGNRTSGHFYLAFLLKPTRNHEARVGEMTRD